MKLTLRSCALAFFAVSVAAAVAARADEAGEAAKEGKDMAIEAIDAFIAKNNIDKSERDWKTHLPKPPKLEFDPAKTYFWHLDTNVGNLKIKLFTDTAPMHASSTVYLTQLGFYDGVAFHRVIPEFMAQGGDPLGRGTGGPGYEYAGEFEGKRKHDKPGLLSMANRGPGTDGSQFFLTFVATPWLDGKHTLFGEVVEGMGTLKELEARGTKPQGRPTEPLEIENARITVE